MTDKSDTLTPPSGSSPLATVRSLSQVQKWWASKISPLLAVSFLGLLVDPRPGPRAAVLLGATLFSACVLASSAYLINDWFDREVDRAAGKTSRVMRSRPAVVLAMVVILDLVGVAPWLALGLPLMGWGALGAVVLLPLVYSAPPLRAKERGALGLVADAALAHVAPTVFALAVFGGLQARGPAEVVLASGAVGWSIFSGLRRIVGHEVVDEPLDRAVGVRTWVVVVGVKRARSAVRNVLLPGEVVALVLVVGALAVVAPLAAVVFVAITASLAFARAIGAWEEPLYAMPTAHRERAVLYPFLTFWPALVLAVALVARNVGFLPVLLAYLLGFWPLLVGELESLRTSGREAVHIVWSGSWNWLRHRLWPFLTATIPNWFRHGLWPFLHHTIPNWFRYQMRPRILRAARVVQGRVVRLRDR